MAGVNHSTGPIWHAGGVRCDIKPLVFIIVLWRGPPKQPRFVLSLRGPQKQPRATVKARRGRHPYGAGPCPYGTATTARGWRRRPDVQNYIEVKRRGPLKEPPSTSSCGEGRPNNLVSCSGGRGPHKQPRSRYHLHLSQRSCHLHRSHHRHRHHCDIHWRRGPLKQPHSGRGEPRDRTPCRSSASASALDAM